MVVKIDEIAQSVARHRKIPTLRADVTTSRADETKMLLSQHPDHMGMSCKFE